MSSSGSAGYMLSRQSGRAPSSLGCQALLNSNLYRSSMRDMAVKDNEQCGAQIWRGSLLVTRYDAPDLARYRQTPATISGTQPRPGQLMCTPRAGLHCPTT